MVVEDSEDIRELLGVLYQSQGYEVLLASDGRDALTQLKNQADLPALILLDLMMPGMDGFEFKVEQDKDQRLAPIPVVIMTADANAKEKSQKIGARGYVRKPVELDTLLAVALKYCGPSKG
jgi:CheY-like chemotaxis protein